MANTRITNVYEEGTKVKVSDLVKGMVIISGNDASVALAEHIAGSEENFIYLMDQYAVDLGLSNSDFNFEWIAGSK